MSGRVFVDTNVLVYALDESEGDKHRQARSWVAALWRARRGCLSAQVLSELYVTVTQKLRPGLPREAARRYASSFRAWEPVAIDLPLIRSAWEVQERSDLSWWDSLIVAAAAAARAGILLSEDLQHGQRIGSVEVLSPFLRPPEDVLG